MMRTRRNGLLHTIFLAAICGILSFSFFLIREHGFFTIANDFDLQQIPFSIALHNALGEGNISGWIWNYDLGHSIIQGFSFYELGSPFFWLYMLFPSNCLPYLIAWLYILKYVAAAAFAYSYLSRFVSDKRNAVIGALLYAFSGFQAVNLMFYHFHDAVALFPLMLTGLEKFAENPEKKLFFVFSVFINCLVNYFFFIQNVIFLVIYFFFRFRRGTLKKTISLAFRCMLCGLWGTAMAAVLFIPSILYIIQSTRIYSQGFMALVWPRYFLYVVRGIFYPGEAMNNQSSLFPVEWRSVGCYLPMVGFSLCTAYILKKRDWLTGVILLLLLMSFVPILSGVFNLYSEWYYRWWYYLVLMSALASIRVLDQEKEYKIRTAAGITTLISAGLYLYIRFAPYPENDPLVYQPDQFFRFAAAAVSGTALVWILWKMRKPGSKWLLPLVCLYAVLSTSLPLYYFKTGSDADNTRNMMEAGMQTETLDEQYRYAGGNNIFNMTGGAAGTGAFSSTVSAGSKQFDALFDYDVSNLSLDKQSVPGLTELLGGKYNISDSDSGNEAVRELKATGKTYYVLEREACPIGFKTEHYITREDLMRHDRSERGVLLLNAAVIEPEEEERLAGICGKVTGDEDVLTDISALVAINRENGVQNFDRDTHGFRCDVNYDSESAVYFSVPYDDGWTAAVDGREADIINSGGMMALIVPAGCHRVVFSYVTPGYRVSEAITAAAWILFAAAAVIQALRHRRLPRPDGK